MKGIEISDVEVALEEIIEKYEIEAEISRYAQKYVDALMVAKKAVDIFVQNGLTDELINLCVSVESDAFLALEDEIKKKLEEIKKEG